MRVALEAFRSGLGNAHYAAISAVLQEISMSPASAAPATSSTYLRARLTAARERSEELFQIVRPEAIYDRPLPERHRIIFYLGHLEAFDWNLLREPLALASFDPEYDKLFAFGIDPVDGGLPSDQAKDWPSFDRVRAYNGQIRERLDAAIEAVAAKDPSFANLDERFLEV